MRWGTLIFEQSLQLNFLLIEIPSSILFFPAFHWFYCLAIASTELCELVLNIITGVHHAILLTKPDYAPKIVVSMARWTLSTGQVHNLQNSSRGTPADGNSHRCKSKAGRCTNNLLTLYWPSTFFYWLSIDSLMKLYWLPLTASDFYWPFSPSFDFYWLWLSTDFGWHYLYRFLILLTLYWPLLPS